MLCPRECWQWDFLRKRRLKTLSCSLLCLVHLHDSAPRAQWNICHHAVRWRRVYTNSRQRISKTFISFYFPCFNAWVRYTISQLLMFVQRSCSSGIYSFRSSWSRFSFSVQFCAFPPLRNTAAAWAPLSSAYRAPSTITRCLPDHPLSAECLYIYIYIG